MTADYKEWFTAIAGFPPHPWQEELGREAEFSDRLLRIPTGFGKTAGVVLAWLYQRVVKGNAAWPLRLAYALPMRVLVNQSAGAIRDWLLTVGSGNEVDLHVLMGGGSEGRYVFAPERPSILLGTQDMLLSRALNRGYGAARGHWPIDFGLLHSDTLWLMDEVQLMGVGLATSAQLNAFRAADSRVLRPSGTWWMSATLQSRWLKTPETEATLPGLDEGTLTIPPERRAEGLWRIRKPIERRGEVDDAAQIAALVFERHAPGTLTLVVVNRVDRAVAVYAELFKAHSQGKGAKRRLRDEAPELRLIHSRFRGQERANWVSEFLNKEATLPETGRVIVATQVVEAGVDLSARLLVTDLAPWASLVQRFGRCARRALPKPESGELVVVGSPPDKNNDKAALPYSALELRAAYDGVGRLVEGSGRGDIAALEAFEEDLAGTDPEALLALYPYKPLHFLLPSDLEELFDTTPDLSGADLDVGRYIREGDDRDVLVFWRELASPRQRLPKTLVGRVEREELCPVPFLKARKWLKGKAAYLFDYLEGAWVKVRDASRIAPGMRVLVDSQVGGYEVERGWTGTARGGARVEPVEPEALAESPEFRFEQTAGDADDDSLSVAGWKTIATHGRETAGIVAALAQDLGIPDQFVRLLTLAARHHDNGKAAETFQSAISSDARAKAGASGARRDLAKAPDGAWRRPAYPARPGFRHELVSTLALFELLRRADPMHEALLGSLEGVFELLGEEPEVAPAGDPSSSLVDELVGLSASEFDLVAYLVLSHHGKVRTSLSATPRDLASGKGALHGVVAGDVFPSTLLAARDGRSVPAPELELSLDLAGLGVSLRYGRSWAERVGALLKRHGPFLLSYLEALLRIADHRASALATEDGALDL